MKENKLVINTEFGGFGLSREAETWLAKRGIWQKYPDLESLYYLPRHEPLLVACVEALGRKANGHCADLSVVTIKHNRYYIEKYDGNESVITEDDFITIPEFP